MYSNQVAALKKINELFLVNLMSFNILIFVIVKTTDYILKLKEKRTIPKGNSSSAVKKN